MLTDMIWAIIVILLVIIDQVTKQIVMAKISYGEFIPVIDKFFYLTYHENKGAAWGIFQNGRLFFIVLTVLIAIVIIYIMTKTNEKLLKLPLAVILGGALGNLIDRTIKGGVGDFLDFYIGSYHFPTFNAADVFVVTGTILLAIYLLFIYKEPAKEKEALKDDANDPTQAGDDADMDASDNDGKADPSGGGDGDGSDD